METEIKSAFQVGDRVTLVESESLPADMVGMKAIVQGVDLNSPEDYMRYHIIYRMDGKTPIERGTDTLADEYLDRSNLKLGWD